MWIRISKKSIIILLIAWAVIFAAGFVMIFLFTLGMSRELAASGLAENAQAAVYALMP